MSVFTSYVSRINMKPDYARERWHKNTASWLNRKLPNSLSYFHLTIDGEARDCAVLSTQNANEKKICTMPGERLKCGSYVEWMDNVWLITELDAPYELYQAGIMTQCNYLLKWINTSGEIVSRWVYVADGTKYLTGEYFNKYMTTGDSRVQVTMPKDSETMFLNRGSRFLIDTPGTGDTQCYEITKLNRTGYVYNDEGVYVHMMAECNRVEDDDNFDLMIANYYSRLQKYGNTSAPVDTPVTSTDTSYISITAADDNGFLLAGDSKTLTATVTVDGETVEDDSLAFTVSDDTLVTLTVDSATAVVTATRDRNRIGENVTITVASATYGLESTCTLAIRGWF